MTTLSIKKFSTCTPPSKSQRLADVEVLTATPPSSGKRKIRGGYSDYSPEQRLKITHYAIENGNSAAARHFSRALRKPLNESTVREMKTSNLKLKKSTDEMKTLLFKFKGLFAKSQIMQKMNLYLRDNCL